MKRALVFAATTAVSFAARAAAAREVDVRLAPGCPEPASVEARIGARDRVTRVTIVRDADGFEGEVVVGDGEARFVRTVKAITCEAVVDALVLVVSLVREPEPARPSKPTPSAAPPSTRSETESPLVPPETESPPSTARELDPAPRIRVGMGVESGTMRAGNPAYGLWAGAWFRAVPLLSFGVEAAATGRVPSCPDNERFGGPLVVPSCRDGRSLQRVLFVPRLHFDVVDTVMSVSMGPLVGVAFSNRHYDVFGYGTQQRGSRGLLWGGQGGVHLGPRWMTVDVPVTVARAPEGLLADEGTLLFTVGLGVSLHVL